MRLNLILNKKNNINSLAVTTGAGLIEGISNAAIKTATQAAIDSVIIQVTTSLANSVITGNKLQLDIETIISSAISAGVLSYVNSSLGTNALTDDMNLSDYVKNATIHGVGQGISSEIRDGDFKDGFATGVLISIVSDGALQMRKYVKDNFDYVGDGELSVGIRGDCRKGGGSHYEKAYENGKLYPKEIIAPTGGSQMGEGKLFGYTYSEDGFINYLVEHFAGPHDFMSSWNYQNIDGVTYLKDNGALVNTASGLLLVPSIPFSLAPIMEDNLDFIHNYKNIRNKNKAINIAKDRK
ncbi:MAG: hypothetical protein RBQ81_08880 [Arcobacteraceae bacterium]|nr:hypothetical protein [Arcobacteraceae bacterium]